MKLLMIYSSRFAYHPAVKSVPEAPDVTEGAEVKNAIVGFIHAEVEDTERASKVTTRLIKNLKWLAGKNNTKTIVLHSFAHLSESKAPADFVATLLDNAQKRLEDAGYEVHQTPLGYFLDLELSAPGFSLARVFQSF
ncbi:MAG: hypothetical protein DSY91_02385 [Deltaproteobacteria bacterium]|nr:MAG: hypothetical protein DSY91_02385 [Deltaproteobacteria bacterium]